MKTRIPYYHNSDATFQLHLLVSGDVNPNPGPSHHTTTSDVLNVGHRITYDREKLLEFKDFGTNSRMFGGVLNH